MYSLFYRKHISKNQSRVLVQRTLENHFGTNLVIKQALLGSRTLKKMLRIVANVLIFHSLQNVACVFPEGTLRKMGHKT